MEVYRQILVKEPDAVFEARARNSSDKVAQFMRGIWDANTIGVAEKFYVLNLNNKNDVVTINKVGEGGLTSVVVDVRLVAKGALDALATSVILVHNHPSGNLKPSESDKVLTRKVKRGLNLFDIRVLDHVIITEDDHFSFADNGIL